MKNKITVTIIFICLLVEILNGQSQSPKREFRGAWVATVINLDWPSSNSLSTAQQKNELIQLFDKLQETNVNAVIFQIRAESDALYNSNYDPWSYWLTGVQGKAPDPYYDPLEFAIEEAHSRGMELHAWLNPYRVERQDGNYPNAENHVSILHPDWVLKIGNIKFLDPGLPQVREYVTNVVMDVVDRYDVDGVHFDDYFYPYPPDQITNEDLSTYNSYPNGYFDIKDWRRNNVNELLRMIHAAIQVSKPHVKFGMSPFGIYKNGVPSGITGLDAYSTIYCDPLQWLDEKIIDYLTPQLYWSFGGGQDYGKLLPWWADQVGDRHFYPGQALYRADIFAPNEIPRQIRLNRSTANVYGSILFRAQNLFGNANGVTDSLENDYFRNKSLVPQMSWKDDVAPINPTNLRYDALQEIRGEGLLWNTPAIASDGDSASMYVVYQFDDMAVSQTDIDNAENIWKIQSNKTSSLNSSDKVSEKMYFGVSALDKNNNESSISNIVEVEMAIPDVPLLAGPENNAVNQRDTTILMWNNSLHSSYNSVQISADPSFDSIVFSEPEVVDTFLAVTGLNGLSQYYWRVSALNIAGESDYSEQRDFTTGFPTIPMLSSPADKELNVLLNTQLTWQGLAEAEEYQVQIAEGLSIEPSITIIDTLVQDTLLSISNLNPEKIYSWHVKGKNQYGFGLWSDVFKFKTEPLTSIADNSLPLEFNLEQNYPNPFNPETTIKFTIASAGMVSLKVYDILGREVAVLLNRNMTKGNYEYNFNASNYSSGMYIYVLSNSKNVISKKMLFVK